MIKVRTKPARCTVLSLLCIAAALLNWYFGRFVFNFLGLPLFVNTIFTAAITFYAGIIPGLAVILINRIFRIVMFGDITFFVLVSIAEVFIIGLLRPRTEIQWKNLHDRQAFAEMISVFASLMLLYVVTSVSASVLGGLINSYLTTRSRLNFSASDIFRGGIFDNGLPQLAKDIFSRFPVNLIDRLIVIFGGYFISRWLRKLA